MSAGIAVGTVRTYARIAPDQAFTYASWMDAVKRAETFVSYGPLLDTNVEGQPMGSRIEMVLVVGFRLGMTTCWACRQSRYSVESWVSQNCRSSSSLVRGRGPLRRAGRGSPGASGSGSARRRVVRPRTSTGRSCVCPTIRCRRRSEWPGQSDGQCGIFWPNEPRAQR